MCVSLQDERAEVAEQEAGGSRTSTSTSAWRPTPPVERLVTPMLFLGCLEQERQPPRAALEGGTAGSTTAVREAVSTEPC